jgi:hypothetical protein
MSDDFDADGESVRTPEDDYREGLRDILMQVASASMNVCLDTPVTAPTPGSPAALLLSSEAEWAVANVNQFPLLDALQNIHMAMRSGHDHVLTLGLSLAVPRGFGSSFATVLRGALEGYAQAWFLLGDLSAKSVLTRYLTARRSVLDQDSKERPDKRGTPEATDLSRESGKMLERVQAMAHAWEIPYTGIKGQGYKKRVDTLLDAYAAASGHDLPPDIYRVLSLSAHSETNGYNRFIKSASVTNEHGQRGFTTGLNYLFLNKMTQILVGVHIQVMRKYLELSGTSREELTEWMEALSFSEEVGQQIWRENTKAGPLSRHEAGEEQD